MVNKASHQVWRFDVTLLQTDCPTCLAATQELKGVKRTAHSGQITSVALHLRSGGKSHPARLGREGRPLSGTLQRFLSYARRTSRMR